MFVFFTVENPCSIGIYGDLCTKNCSCHTGENCTEVQENCERGCAVPWTGAACDQSEALFNFWILLNRIKQNQLKITSCM